MKVFSDRELKSEITNSVLFENQDYFLQFENAELALLKKEPTSLKFIDLLPFGKIGRINFTNKVGFFSLLNNRFDVRSKKLGDISGNEQAKLLVNEINEIFRRLSFNYSGITSASRKTDFSSINTDLLARFDYIRQAILSSNGPTFENCLNLIISQPHHKLQEETVTTYYHKAKNVVLKEVFGSKTKYINLTTDKLDHLTITKKIKAKGKSIFPHAVLESKKSVCVNTIENQFVKYFLVDISNLCQYIIGNYQNDQAVILDAKRIKNIVGVYLANPFFREVGNLHSIPYTSTKLLKGNGYKELFQHYVISRHSFHHILERINNAFSGTGLNDISYLYEVWCFLKVADLLFKGQIDVLSESQVYKNGSLTYRFLWRDKNTAIGFNISYSYSGGSSYSLTFRPDISIRTGYGTAEENLILLDAKYKVIGNLSEVFNDPDEPRTYNAADIHKMHSYLDAIPKASSSFILYPGNQFIYFTKDFKRYFDSKIKLERGVGAIPLVPGNPNNDLENIIRSIA